MSILRAGKSARALATTESILDHLCDVVVSLRDLHISAPCPKLMALLLKPFVPTDKWRDLKVIDLLTEDDRDRFKGASTKCATMIKVRRTEHLLGIKAIPT